MPKKATKLNRLAGFHALFGAMRKTPLAMEFQITQAYLGFSTNLVFMPSLFKEVLESNTYANGKIWVTVRYWLGSSIFSFGSHRKRNRRVITRRWWKLNRILKNIDQI